MTDKPRIRVAAGTTYDSFQNFLTRTGIGTGNLSSGGTYGFNPISRNRQLLEWMYGGSWVVQRAVDSVAEDMTRAGIEIDSPGPPDEVEKLNAAQSNLDIWPQLCDNIKWARLYGGSIAIMLIDGQNPATPLRPETVGRGQFKGLAVVDRWMVWPSQNNLVTEYGPDLGQPLFYDVVVNQGPFPAGRVHYSRVIRMDGIKQPYWRKQAENGWGLSIVEPMYDRLVAYDSTTQGVAQLVYKAHLRTLKVEGLRDIIASGGPALTGLTKQVEMIRAFQSSEGLTLLDAKDEFDVHQYTFSGLDAVMDKFGDQLCGAIDVPRVRLLGESPGGLGSNGEGELNNYYDMCTAKQNSKMRRPLTRLLTVLHYSELGRAPDEGFDFKFVPLYQMTEKEKAEVATATSTAVETAFSSAVIDKPTALRELRSSSKVTGMWTNITDEVIEAAVNEPDLMLGEVGGEPGDLLASVGQGEPGAGVTGRPEKTGLAPASAPRPGPPAGADDDGRGGEDFGDGGKGGNVRPLNARKTA